MTGLDLERFGVGGAGIGLAALALVVLAVPVTFNLPGASLVFFEVAITFLLYGMLIIGLNLHYGWAGLINFGHVVFFAVGGYTMALLTAQDPLLGVGLGLPWPVGVGGAVLAAVAVGSMLGISSLQLRDDFLAVVTLAAAQIFHQVITSLESITGGEQGILNVPQPINELAGGSHDTTMIATVLLFGGLLAITYSGVNQLTESPYGRVLRAINADEQVTRALGKDVSSYKIRTFIYGGALAGFAGALHASYIGAVSPGFYPMHITILLWIGMLLAGAGSHRGVLAGLAVVQLLQLAIRFLNGIIPVAEYQFVSLRFIVLGALLVVVIRYKPEGIWGDADRQGVSKE